MGTKVTQWRPSWWTEEVHGSAWERAREAMRRDWMQTKHDLHLGGHEMNQSIGDTVRQATAKQHLPTSEQANPPKIIGEWPEAEALYRYGHAARLQYGAEHPQWSVALEQKLAGEWTTGQNQAEHDWSVVRLYVRRAYEQTPDLDTITQAQGQSDATDRAMQQQRH